GISITELGRCNWWNPPRQNSCRAGSTARCNARLDDWSNMWIAMVARGQSAVLLMGRAISTLNPTPCQLRARMVHRRLRRGPFVAAMMRRTIPVGRCNSTPVGRGVIVHGLGQLVPVLVVLLAQGVVLCLQPVALGSLVEQGLLARLVRTLLRGERLVLLALRLFFLGLLIGGQAILVQRVEVAGVGVLPGQPVLTQAQIAVDHLAVVGLVQQFALAIGARMIGVGDGSALRALVDVLRAGSGGHQQQRDGHAARIFSCYGGVHGSAHSATTRINKALTAAESAVLPTSLHRPATTVQQPAGAQLRRGISSPR